MAPKKTTANAPAAAATSAPLETPPPAAAALPATPESTSTATTATTTPTASERIAALAALATATFNNCKEILAAIKVLQKDVARLEKEASKRPGRRAAAKTAAGTGEDGEAARRPSGFAKPTLLSGELCDFLGLPHDSRLARTECTRLLNKYIKDNNLQDKEDKRTIQPDGKLQKVLQLDKGDKVTYFNLQRAIKHHFVKDAAAAAPAVVA